MSLLSYVRPFARRAQASLARLQARWSGLHPLSTAARTAMLAVLQPLAEIHEMVRQLQQGRASRWPGSGNGEGGAGLRTGLRNRVEAGFKGGNEEGDCEGALPPGVCFLIKHALPAPG